MSQKSPFIKPSNLSGRCRRQTTLPESACQSWTQLYKEAGTFLGDLDEHIRLKADLLFPQFETQVAHHV